MGCGRKSCRASLPQKSGVALLRRWGVRAKTSISIDQDFPRPAVPLMNADRLLERFLRYVQIDTTAREGAGVYPSSPGQIELGRLILGELQAMGLADATQNAHGIVVATLPANVATTGKNGDAPVIAFNAHFDTSPETTGRGRSTASHPQLCRRRFGFVGRSATSAAGRRQSRAAGCGSGALGSICRPTEPPHTRRRRLGRVSR